MVARVLGRVNRPPGSAGIPACPLCMTVQLPIQEQERGQAHLPNLEVTLIKLKSLRSRPFRSQETFETS